MSSSRYVVVAFVCALLAGLPFLNKAFTIDDTPVLKVAQQIVKDPLRPFSCEINWSHDPQPMFEETTNPPFLSYVLAPFVARWGLNERVLHLPMVIFLVIGAAAMAALAVRFTSGSVWPMVFVMSTPAVVVSCNLMRDVPAMALSAASVAAFVWGSDRDDKRLLALGAGFAGLAMLTKYSCLILFVVLGAYPVVRRKPRDLLWLLIPMLMVGLWSLQNIVVHGRTHLAFLGNNRFDEKGFSRTSKFLSLMTIIGSLIVVWPVAIIHDVVERKRLRVICWALAPLIATGIFMTVRSQEPRATLSFFLLVSAGTSLIAWIVCEAMPGIFREEPTVFGDNKGRTDTIFLTWWLVCCLSVAVFGVFFQAVRHVLPAVPPLVLLAMGIVQRNGLEKRLKPVLTACVLVQVGLSAMIGAADAQFADSARAFMRDEIPRLRQTRSEIWFCGNWGFRTYAESSGLKDALFQPPHPAEGSLLIWPVMTNKSRFDPQLKERLILREEHTFAGSIPIRTMSREAGFYSTVRWRIPFRWTNEAKEVIRVYQVGPPESGVQNP